jgi:hypothetical protein
VSVKGDEISRCNGLPDEPIAIIDDGIQQDAAAWMDAVLAAAPVN